MVRISPVLDWTALGIASRKYFQMSGIPTQLLVVHSAECPLRGGYAQSLTKWASPVYPAGPEASWQRFVDPIVRLRFIPDHLGAWHASEANGLSIGWEQAGYAAFTRKDWTTPEGMQQLHNLAYDMAEVAKRDGIPPVWLTNKQVRDVLDRGVRSIKGFCTHRQIDPESRTDPGNGYPYDLLMAQVKIYMGHKPPVVVAPPKPAPAPKPIPKTNFVPDLHWRVDPGDTLGKVATYFGVSVRDLAAWNGVRNINVIRVGERLWKPGDGYGTWTVDPGDTLYSIARWCQANWSRKISVNSICYANGINDPSKLTVGLRLKIA